MDEDIKEARKSVLKSQLEHAVVEHIGTEANDYPSWDMGTYSVFVPGAFRERNLVKVKLEEGADPESAELKAQAVEKVRVCLERKIDAIPEYSPTNGYSAGDGVEVQPDKLSVKTKGLDKLAQRTEE